MARNPRSIGARVKDARSYERELRRTFLNPIFIQLRERLRQATSPGGALWIVSDVIESRPWLRSEELGESAADAIGVSLERINLYHYQRMVITFRTALKVDIRPYLSSPGVRADMTQRIAENVALIKTIPLRLHADLRVFLERALVSEPFDQELLTKVIRKTYRSSGYNLRRIVRDQTNKTIGQLTHLRQQQVGIQSYQWLTSQDERVRPSHVRNSGLIFDWAKPPPDTGSPGQDVLCRCSAIPIVTQATRRRLGAPGAHSILAPTG